LVTGPGRRSGSAEPLCHRARFLALLAASPVAPHGALEGVWAARPIKHTGCERGARIEARRRRNHAASVIVRQRNVVASV